MSFFEPSVDGLLFSSPADQAADDYRALLRQLAEDDFLTPRGTCFYTDWERFYDLLEDERYGLSLSLLRLPPVMKWRPVVTSSGALSDSDFGISLSAWLDPAGKEDHSMAVCGALITGHSGQQLLPRYAWETNNGIIEFNRRPLDERNQIGNQRHWATIRSSAVRADAVLSDFLRNTVVLTPDRLKLALRKGDVADSRLVEIQPTFEGAPENWLNAFDRSSTVRARYDVSDGKGLTVVLPSEDVRQVLEEIKQLPGRRVAGDRAEAFLRNPFAILGPIANAVLDPAEFESARHAAGLTYAQFAINITRDTDGRTIGASLVISETLQTPTQNVLPFDSPAALGTFALKLRARIDAAAESIFHEGYDLELLGDAADQLRVAERAQVEWCTPHVPTAVELFDIGNYSGRIAEFGVEQSYYSPFIAKRSAQRGWFPDNVTFGIRFTPTGSPEPIAVELSAALRKQFLSAVEDAKSEGSDTVVFAGCPTAIPISEAITIAACLDSAHTAISTGEFKPTPKLGKNPKSDSTTVVLKPNIDGIDYEERRGALASPAQPTVLIPGSLRAGVKLKEHQRTGLAWLQHLWSRSPADCRGALLADDMGVGKSLQILSFVASCFEVYPSLEPVLIVAPLSLLDNWESEAQKFFGRSFPSIHQLYGESLRLSIVKRADLPEEVRQKGITRLLRRDWLGSKRIVLTTYETLRDLEFSLARQSWSVMICDEAQWIKNPNALASRAAKKQKARFKIACTGTPVENSLADLWSLFDFIQPGLLGSLNKFGIDYRKPIEAKTPEEKARLEKLREIIEPQTLRRLKSDVAKDLPRKIEDDGCRQLPITPNQRALYWEAETSRRSQPPGGRSVDALKWLLRIRDICSDPVPIGSLSATFTSATELESQSAKILWLGGVLTAIQAKGEKALVFCESRNLQRTLQKYISHRIGIEPDIINGSTSATVGDSNSRGQRIARFQAKPGFNVIILSPIAAGVGLNIQAANHVIHFTRHWNPAKEDQATDRAYRIGQERDVIVYYPTVTAEFDTFDAVLDRLLSSKRRLSQDMLNGSSDLTIAEFSGAVEDKPTSVELAESNDWLTPDDIASLDPVGLESFCATVWRQKGYFVYLTPTSGDGGIDVVGIKDSSEGVLIQCKTSKNEKSSLGWDAIKEVVAGSTAYILKHSDVHFEKMAVTNAGFNATAKLQALINGVKLYEGADLVRLLETHKMSWRDIRNTFGP